MTAISLCLLSFASCSAHKSGDLRPARCCGPSLTFSLHHVTSRTRPSPFLRVTLKMWEWPGDEATFFPLCKFNTQVRILMYRVRPPSQRLILRLQIRSYCKNVCFWIRRFLRNTYSSTHTQELLMHRAQY